jgi:hypothetical protein
MIKKIFGNRKNNGIKKYSSEDIAKINERAYFIWLNSGKPADSAERNWLLAEKELKKEGKI